MRIDKETLHNLINLKGMKEQSFKFAFGFHGGMKQCYHSGAEIFCPLNYALYGVDLSKAIQLNRILQGETLCF